MLQLLHLLLQQQQLLLLQVLSCCAMFMVLGLSMNLPLLMLLLLQR